MPGITNIHHVAITVTDLGRSVPWYEETLGLTRLLESTHPDGTGYYVLLGDPSVAVLVGLHTHPTNAGERFVEARTGLDHVGFGVADHDELERWERRLTELGVLHSPVDDQDLYSVVVFRDPDDVQLEFVCLR